MDSPVAAYGVALVLPVVTTVLGVGIAAALPVAADAMLGDMFTGEPEAAAEAESVDGTTDQPVGQPESSPQGEVSSAPSDPATPTAPGPPLTQMVPPLSAVQVAY